MNQLVGLVMTLAAVVGHVTTTQDEIDKSCVDNGGIVAKYERYHTCSILKPGVRTQESKMKHTSH